MTLKCIFWTHQVCVDAFQHGHSVLAHLCVGFVVLNFSKYTVFIHTGVMVPNISCAEVALKLAVVG